MNFLFQLEKGRGSRCRPGCHAVRCGLWCSLRMFGPLPLRPSDRREKGRGSRNASGCRAYWPPVLCLVPSAAHASAEDLPAAPVCRFPIAGWSGSCPLIRSGSCRPWILCGGAVVPGVLCVRFSLCRCGSLIGREKGRGCLDAFQPGSRLCVRSDRCRPGFPPAVIPFILSRKIQKA